MEEWYKNYRKKLYSKRDFRKERYKRLLIFVGIVAILILAYAYDLFGVKTALENINLNDSKAEEIPPINLSYTPIKDLIQGPGDYSGREINISGMLNNRVGGYSLDDDNGNWIWLKDNCLENGKKYSYNAKIYAAKGTYVPPKQKEYALDPMVGKEYQPNFNCSSSIY